MRVFPSVYLPEIDNKIAYFFVNFRRIVTRENILQKIALQATFLHFVSGRVCSRILLDKNGSEVRLALK